MGNNLPYLIPGNDLNRYFIESTHSTLVYCETKPFLLVLSMPGCVCALYVEYAIAGNKIGKTHTHDGLLVVTVHVSTDGNWIMNL